MRTILPVTGAVEVGGHRLVFDQYGSGDKVVVLLHGLLMRRSMHIPLATELARRGVLFASGPFVGADGAPTGDGLSIFNTSSAEEARSFAERDPFYVHGLRKFDVKEWMLMEGSMTVTLNFAERTLDAIPEQRAERLSLPHAIDEMQRLAHPRAGQVER